MVDDQVTQDALKKVEEKQSKTTNWTENLPAGFILIFIALIGLLLLYAYNTGGDYKKIIPWIIMIAIAWYILGSKTKKEGILTEMEAKAILKNIIKMKRRNGEIPPYEKWIIDINADLQYIDGEPKDYLIGINIVKSDFRTMFKQAKINSWNGNVTFQDAMGRITGHEKPYIRSPIPQVLKQYEKHQKLFKGLFGGSR